MSNFQWPSDDGWPYPDSADASPQGELADPDGGVDDDAMVLRAAPRHVFDQLDPLERRIITAHYGLAGAPPLTMKQLHHQWDMSRADLRQALATGLAKLRVHLRE